MTVSHFFYEDPKTRTQMPLTVYLGGLGPLRARFYQAAPPGPFTNIAAFSYHLPASAAIQTSAPPGPLTNIVAFSYHLPVSAGTSFLLRHRLPGLGDLSHGACFQHLGIGVAFVYRFAEQCVYVGSGRGV